MILAFKTDGVLCGLAVYLNVLSNCNAFVLFYLYSPVRHLCYVVFFHLQRINPLKLNSWNCYTMPCRPNLPFSISDVRALWRSALSARVPECQKLKMVG